MLGSLWSLGAGSIVFLLGLWTAYPRYFVHPLGEAGAEIMLSESCSELSWQLNEYVLLRRVEPYRELNCFEAPSIRWMPKRVLKPKFWRCGTLSSRPIDDFWMSMSCSSGGRVHGLGFRREWGKTPDECNDRFPGPGS